MWYTICLHNENHLVIDYLTKILRVLLSLEKYDFFVTLGYWSKVYLL